MNKQIVMLMLLALAFQGTLVLGVVDFTVPKGLGRNPIKAIHCQFSAPDNRNPSTKEIDSSMIDFLNIELSGSTSAIIEGSLARIVDGRQKEGYGTGNAYCFNLLFRSKKENKNCRPGFICPSNDIFKVIRLFRADHIDIEWSNGKRTGFKKIDAEVTGDKFCDVFTISWGKDNLVFRLPDSKNVMGLKTFDDDGREKNTFGMSLINKTRIQINKDGIAIFENRPKDGIYMTAGDKPLNNAGVRYIEFIYEGGTRSPRWDVNNNKQVSICASWYKGQFN